MAEIPTTRTFTRSFINEVGDRIVFSAETDSGGGVTLAADGNGFRNHPELGLTYVELLELVAFLSQEDLQDRVALERKQITKSEAAEEEITDAD